MSFNVTLPNGATINDIPDGTTKEEIKSKAISSGLAVESDFNILSNSNYAAHMSLNKGLASNASPEQRALIDKNLSDDDKEMLEANNFYSIRDNKNYSDTEVKAQIEYEYGRGARASRANKRNRKAIDDKFTDSLKSFGLNLKSIVQSSPSAVKDFVDFSKKYKIYPILNKLNLGVLSAADVAIKQVEEKEPDYFNEMQAKANATAERASKLQAKYLLESDVGFVEAIQDNRWDIVGNRIGNALAFEAPKLTAQIILALITKNPIAAVGFGGVTAAGQEYASMELAEDDLTKRVLQPFGVGVVNIVTEKLGTGKILDDLMKRQIGEGISKSIVKEGLKGAGRGFVSEGSATLGENVIAKAFGEELGLLDNVLLSGIVGTILDGSIASLGTGITEGDAVRIRKQNSNEQIDAIVKQSPILNQNSETAQAATEALKNPTEENVDNLNKVLFDDTQERNAVQEKLKQAEEETAQEVTPTEELTPTEEVIPKRKTESDIQGVPPAENAQKTQSATTKGTYIKTANVLNNIIPEGQILDFGAGRGIGAEAINAKTYEPFPREGFTPDFTDASKIPSNSESKINSSSVINVVPKDIRDGIVLDIGRILKQDGVAIITSRTEQSIKKGAENIKLFEGEEGAYIVGKEGEQTFQKGYSQKQLVEYVQGILGNNFEVTNAPKTTDGKNISGSAVLIKKLKATEVTPTEVTPTEVTPTEVTPTFVEDLKTIKDTNDYTVSVKEIKIAGKSIDITFTYKDGTKTAAILTPQQDSVDIKSLVSDVKGQGRGTQLMQEIIKLADKNNTKLTATAYNFTKSPVDFYKKLGFKVDGEDAFGASFVSYTPTEKVTPTETPTEIPIIKTKKGSVIKRYQDNVGKRVGSKIYVHKNYASEIVPKDILDAAIAKLPSDFAYNTITYDTKTQSVRFDEAPDFDTATEPRVGKIFTVNKDGTTKQSSSNSIWHHKWTWVKDDYTGFDVNASRNWSATYSPQLDRPKGTQASWDKQLEEANIFKPTEVDAPPIDDLPTRVKIDKASNIEFNKIFGADLSRADYQSQENSIQQAIDKNISVDDVRAKINNKQAVNNEELAALLLRKVELVNELESINNRMEQTTDEIELVDLIEEKRNKIDQSIDLTETIRQGATTIGRTLQFLSTAMDRKTFTLENSIIELKTNTGKEVTPEQRKALENLYKELTKVRTEIADFDLMTAEEKLILEITAPARRLRSTVTTKKDKNAALRIIKQRQDRLFKIIDELNDDLPAKRKVKKVQEEDSEGYLAMIENVQKELKAKRVKTVSIPRKEQRLETQIQDLEGKSLTLQSLIVRENELNNKRKQIKDSTSNEAKLINSQLKEIADQKTALQEKRKAAPKIVSDRILELEVKKKQLQEEINIYIESQRPKTDFEKFQLVYDIFRNAKLTADIGHLFRQGGIVISNPKLWGKEYGGEKFFKESFKAFNKVNADKIEVQIRDDDLYQLAIDAGLRLVKQGDKLGQREEILQNNLIDKIPVIGDATQGFARIQITGTNFIRYAAFKSYMEGIQNPTLQDAKDAAKAVNILTGYGVYKATGGTVEKALNLLLISPRFAASRLQAPVLLTQAVTQSVREKAGIEPRDGKQYINKQVRKRIIEDAAFTFATRLGLMFIASLMFDDVEIGDDPKSWTYGRLIVRLGRNKYRVYDPWAGMSSALNPLRRSIFEEGMIDVGTIGKFLETRGHPAFTAVNATVFGKDYFGKEIGKVDAVATSISPIVVEGIRDAIEKDTGLLDLYMAVSTDVTGVPSLVVEKKSIPKKTFR
jgi:hypothetical protein